MNPTVRVDWTNMQKDVDKLKRIVLEGDGPNEPSLVTSVATMTTKLDTILQTVEKMAKIIVVGLGVIATILTINTLLGPALRKTIGLPEGSTLNAPAGHSEKNLPSFFGARDDTQVYARNQKQQESENPSLGANQ